MSGRVPYSAAQPGGFITVPSSYVSQLIRQVEDPLELKLTLLAFYVLSRARDYPAYVTASELELRAASILGIDADTCREGLQTVVRRGVLLEAMVPLDGTDTEVYFANIEADLQAIEDFKERLVVGGGEGSSTPTQNIFELYEQNIGVLTPMIAEELKDAQRTYRADWIEEAFREAVLARKLNWKYICRILERWTAEGKDSGTNRPGSGQSDADKYIKGRFGHIVRR
ncbi:MAG: DnaD domain protein [Dehalococcoidia bacterium]|nr:DnaD domain protein [Dehalococcoidia bacterium]